MQAIRSGKVDPFIGKRIGRYIQSTHLRDCVNFLSHQSKRYRYELVVDEEMRRESELFKNSPSRSCSSHPSSNSSNTRATICCTRYGIC